MFFFEFSTFNALFLAVNALVLKQNTALWRMNFMAANGIVLWATIPWKNSLTFSSVNSITSFAVHFLPAVVTYAERHLKPSNDMYTYMCPHQMPGVPNCGISGVEAIVNPIIVSLAWNIAYLFTTEVVFSRQIYKQRSLKTSLLFAVSNDTVIYQQLTKLARNFKFITKQQKLEDKRYLLVGLYAGK